MSNTYLSIILSRSPMELFERFDCSSMAFDPPIPPPKPVDLNKSIKGRFYYLSEDVETVVNQSLAAPIQSNGHLLDFYQDLRLKSMKKEQSQ